MIPDYAACYFLWHFAFGHLVLWQILSCEPGAVDGSSKSIGMGIDAHIELLYALD